MKQKEWSEYLERLAVLEPGDAVPAPPGWPPGWSVNAGSVLVLLAAVLLEHERGLARLRERLDELTGSEGLQGSSGDVAVMTRQQLFDALPLHMQAALPTWPLPTRAQILHYHAMLRDRS